jgi:8-oxo-dGTP pyrophosphatase MutT (NUDIX family)
MSTADSDYKKTTIVFPFKDGEILMGMKKRGFGQGWWNGFGGKLESGESYEDSARRETVEEVGIEVGELVHIADLHFYFDDVLQIVSRVYRTDFTGEPVETEEMRPQFFATDDLPYDTMWPGDDKWIPQVLADEVDQPLGFIVHFDKDNAFKSIEEVPINQLKERF